MDPVIKIKILPLFKIHTEFYFLPLKVLFAFENSSRGQVLGVKRSKKGVGKINSVAIFLELLIT